MRYMRVRIAPTQLEPPRHGTSRDSVRACGCTTLRPVRRRSPLTMNQPPPHSCPAPIVLWSAAECPAESASSSAVVPVDTADDRRAPLTPGTERCPMHVNAELG